MENKIQVNKTASICALFAPISIIVTTLFSTLGTLIINNLLNRYTGYTYESVTTWTNLGNGIVAVLSLGIDIGLYLIFVRRNLKKLPLVLCLLAPGSSALIAPVSNLTMALLNALGLTLRLSFINVVNEFVFILFAFARAALIYFVVRWLFIKLLSNAKEETAE
jgi:hypothetical protein